MKPLAYLAGPISGLSYEGSNNWRERVRLALLQEGIESLSPMRGKTFLSTERSLGDHYPEDILTTEEAIFTRDEFDCRRADLIFCNLLGAQRVSIGTMWELAWAYAYRKPVVLVVEPTGNIHEHAFLRQSKAFRVATLPEAVDVTRGVLLPG